MFNSQEASSEEINLRKPAEAQTEENLYKLSLNLPFSLIRRKGIMQLWETAKNRRQIEIT